MLGFGAISSSAISALADDLLNPNFSAVFAGSVTYEAQPYLPYVQFVNGQGTRIAYAIELSVRAVR